MIAWVEELLSKIGTFLTEMWTSHPDNHADPYQARYDVRDEQTGQFVEDEGRFRFTVQDS